MSKKQTAVEFSEELINVILYYLDDNELERIKEVFDEAKEMEKQQIIEAWIDGNDSEPKETTGHYAEQYYEQTFNN